MLDSASQSANTLPHAGAGNYSSVEGSDVGQPGQPPRFGAWRPFLQRSRRRVNQRSLLFCSLELIRAYIELADLTAAVEVIETLEDALHDDPSPPTAPEDPPREQVSHVSLRSERNRRYYVRRRSKTLASESKTPKTSDSVLQASESLSLSSSFLKISQDLEDKKEREERDSACKTPKTPSKTLSKTPRGERPPPTDTPQPEIDAWCKERGLPVGHPALERFLDEQRTAKLAKTDWRATWRRNEPRITLTLQDEAAKRARLNGAKPPWKPEETPAAPYHASFKAPPSVSREQIVTRRFTEMLAPEPEKQAPAVVSKPPVKPYQRELTQAELEDRKRDGLLQLERMKANGAGR